MKKIDLINACSSLGITVDGAEIGPMVLEQYINKENINKIITLKADPIQKEKEENNNKRNLTAVNTFNKKLYDIVYDSILEESLPITIGGDHSIAIASGLAAIKIHENLGIIWFDSHGDFNTFETSATGNLHGLPLAVLSGFEKKSMAEFHHGKMYPFSNTVIVGARDIDSWEWPNIKKAGITVFSSDDIKKQGIVAITRKAFQIAANGTNGVHVSYDIDVIDPKIAKGVSVPAINGIDELAAYEFLDVVSENKNIITSLDLVEFNPNCDTDGKTRNHC